MDTVKTKWLETPRPYSSYEVEISNNYVIFKEWWDPGHDPNRWEISLHEFEGSSLAQNLKYHLGEVIYQEVLDSVKKIMG